MKKKQNKRILKCLVERNNLFNRFAYLVPSIATRFKRKGSRTHIKDINQEGFLALICVCNTILLSGRNLSDLEFKSYAAVSITRAMRKLLNKDSIISRGHCVGKTVISLDDISKIEYSVLYDRGPPPEEHVIGMDEYEYLMCLINGLQFDQIQVLNGLFNEQLTQRQVADKVDMSQATVNRLYAKALKILAQRYKMDKN